MVNCDCFEAAVEVGVVVWWGEGEEITEVWEVILL